MEKYKRHIDREFTQTESLDCKQVKMVEMSEHDVDTRKTDLWTQPEKEKWGKREKHTQKEIHIHRQVRHTDRHTHTHTHPCKLKQRATELVSWQNFTSRAMAEVPATHINRHADRQRNIYTISFWQQQTWRWEPWQDVTDPGSGWGKQHASAVPQSPTPAPTTVNRHTGTWLTNIILF